MTPTFYVDYKINVRSGMPGAGVAHASSALLNCLHIMFSLHPGKFAIDLPAKAKDGFVRTTTIRVFAQSIEDHQVLHDFFRQSIQKGCLDERIFSAGFPTKVPDDFKGPYRALYRERIKTRSKNMLRVKKMRELEESNATYINVTSNTNGHKFRFYFRIENGQPDQNVVSQLTSYGMSVFGSPLYLPQLP